MHLWFPSSWSFTLFLQPKLHLEPRPMRRSLETKTFAFTISGVKIHFLNFWNFIPNLFFNRCSRPLGNFDDFNHIISNLSYIILGFFFLFIVYLKSRRYKKTERVSPSPPPVLGTLRQLGMFYALGFGLMGQGLMSTCFHICPTTITIQFDTSVMYMILIISIVKIGQFRHPGEWTGIQSRHYHPIISS